MNDFLHFFCFPGLRCNDTKKIRAGKPDKIINERKQYFRKIFVRIYHLNESVLYCFKI